MASGTETPASHSGIWWTRVKKAPFTLNWLDCNSCWTWDVPSPPGHHYYALCFLILSWMATKFFNWLYLNAISVWCSKLRYGGSVLCDSWIQSCPEFKSQIDEMMHRSLYAKEVASRMQARPHTVWTQAVELSVWWACDCKSLIIVWVTHVCTGEEFLMEIWRCCLSMLMTSFLLRPTQELQLLDTW